MGYVTIKLISNGFNGTSKSFLFVKSGLNDARFLFNCGEGTQRIANELNVHITKIKHLVFTRNSWDCYGGITGKILTVANEVKPWDFDLTVHAPFDFAPIFKLISEKNKLHAYKIKQHSYAKNGSFCITDEIRVDAISLHEPIAQDMHSTALNYAYLITIKKESPKLDIEKLVEYNIPEGALRGRLKKGENIVLDNGQVVHAKDCYVKGTVHEDTHVLVVDCPSVDLIKRVQSHPDLNRPNINLMIHVSSAAVLANEAYRTWIKTKNHIEHIILDETYPNIHSKQQHDFQQTLSFLDPKVFPDFRINTQDDANRFLTDENVVYGTTNLFFKLRPIAAMDKSNVFTTKASNTEQLIEKACEESGMDNFHGILADFKETIRQKRLMHHTARHTDPYPKVVFLGTGSSTPHSLRNYSSILVMLNSTTSIMLDCGEDTLGQIKRFFKHDYQNELKKIKALFISHHHVDHIMGIYGLVSERKRVCMQQDEIDDKLFVCAPQYVENFLVSLNDTFGGGFSEYFSLVKASSLYSSLYTSALINTTYKQNKASNQLTRVTTEALRVSLNMKKIVAVPVVHSPGSCGYVFEIDSNPPFKLVFSGDCRPSDDLVESGRDCNLLIHEATFDEDLLDQAIEKNHSTVKEAESVGTRMNADFIALWHFSQRYNRIPLFNDIIERNSKIIISFDNMIMDRHDLELLPSFNKLYKILFKRSDAENLRRTGNRKRPSLDEYRLAKKIN